MFDQADKDHMKHSVLKEMAGPELAKQESIL
jgi:hypothetical protein